MRGTSTTIVFSSIRGRADVNDAVGLRAFRGEFVNVKCPSCSQTFYVEPKAAGVNTGNDFAFYDQAPHIASPQPRSPGASMRSRRKETLVSRLTYDPDGATSSRRYPNLMRYLLFSKTLVTLLFTISMARSILRPGNRGEKQPIPSEG